MKFGANLLLFSDTVDDAVLAQFATLRELGFDGAEVPVFEPSSVPVDAIRRAAEQHGLQLTTSGALPPGTSLYGEGPELEAARGYVRAAVRVAATLGAPVVCGPLYKPVGDTDQSIPLDEQRTRVATVLKPLADEAAESGVTLALEPLNRFETNFLNITEDAVAFCKAVDSPGVGLLLDTFHMHIEEKDTAAAIRLAAQAGAMTHLHVAENDRGVAGTGQVHWQSVAAAVTDSGYDQWVVLESFNQSNQAIRRAVSCWRAFYPSEREFLEQGLRFARGLLT